MTRMAFYCQPFRLPSPLSPSTTSSPQPRTSHLIPITETSHYHPFWRSPSCLPLLSPLNTLQPCEPWVSYEATELAWHHSLESEPAEVANNHSVNKSVGQQFHFFHSLSAARVALFNLICLLGLNMVDLHVEHQCVWGGLSLAMSCDGIALSQWSLWMWGKFFPCTFFIPSVKAPMSWKKYQHSQSLQTLHKWQEH